ncbi:DUF3048 domain-containing protein [Parafrigoribacterium soli]|uniref:DUF3048 domain-containing protein n=1 Tax=Parafrigoribacterium soli TaxID=3144663 RepID=UPI0032EC7BBB
MGNRRAVTTRVVRGAKPTSLVVLVALLAFAASGCASESPKPKPTTSPGYSSSYTPPPATALAPLRGTSVSVGSLKNASIAAKIDNHPDARPQVGLEHTDLLFEELVEGGLTRYVAVWQSDIPELLGPVRSIRPMDPNIISPLGGIVCYSGGQQRFVNLMRQTPVYNAIHGQPDTASTFFRTKDKAAPHNVLVKARELLAQHKDLAAPAQQFAYSLDVPSATATKDGAPTATLSYKFSNLISGSWSYDAGKKHLLRTQAGKADLDATGTQLSATNVVVLRVAVTNDTNVPRTEMIGGGEAWVSTGGGTSHATWSKGSPTDPIHLVDDQGVTIRLAPGNTWIELVPHAGAVQITAPAAS